MLDALDADTQVLQALGRELYGPDNHQDLEHLRYMFLSQRLCNLALHEEYLCYMKYLLITSGKTDDPTYLKYYLHSFPSHVPDVVEQYFNDKQINLSGMSLA